MKTAILHVRTNKNGSDVETDTCIPVDEWNAMSDDEQNKAISELIWELIDCHVTTD